MLLIIRLCAAILLLLPARSAAQSSGYGELDANDVRVRIHSIGAIGRLGGSGFGQSQPGFEVPKDSGRHVLWSGGLGIAGMDSNGTARTAVSFFGSAGDRDLFPGPLTTDGSATTTPEISALYDRVWIVDRGEIVAHLLYHQCLSDPNCDPSVSFPGYTVPASISEWPAEIPFAGYAPLLAPFHDADGDGSYGPGAGDAPCILGDQAMFTVFNDNLATHTESGGLAMGIEGHLMAFVFKEAGPALDQTVFLRYKLINRSAETFTDMAIGFFNDFDLGCFNDDFFGTDPSRNLQYVYNWSDLDLSCFSALGYGDSPPAIGMVVLKGPPLDPNGTDDPHSSLLPAWNGHGFDDGIADNERYGLTSSMAIRREGSNTATTDPFTPVHWYNYLRSTWKDGMPLTYGGFGYSTSPEAVPCRFTYPGDGDTVGAGTDGVVMPPWSETDPTPSNPDRRGTIGSGPFTLAPGQHIDLLYAYVFARSSEGALASVAALQARTDSVRAFAATLPIWDQADATPWNGQCADLLEVGITEHPGALTISMFPNPAGSAVLFDVPPALVGGLLMVRDATGRTVIRQRIVTGRDRVDLGALRPGMYLYEARSPAGRAVGRLIKE